MSFFSAYILSLGSFVSPFRSSSALPSTRSCFSRSSAPKLFLSKGLVFLAKLILRVFHSHIFLMSKPGGHHRILLRGLQRGKGRSNGLVQISWDESNLIGFSFYPLPRRHAGDWYSRGGSTCDGIPQSWNDGFPKATSSASASAGLSAVVALPASPASGPTRTRKEEGGGYFLVISSARPHSSSLV